MSDELDIAERSVIGASMLSVAAAEAVTSILKSTDFYDWKYSILFEAVKRLLDSGEVPDTIAVTDRLIVNGELNKIGGASYVHALTDGVPTASNAAYYAGIVKEASDKRLVLRVAQEVQQAIVESDGSDAWTLMERLQGAVDGASTEIAGAADVPRVADYFQEVIDNLKEEPTFVPTPWADLNPLIDGWRPGALYVIGARPGGGKSILGLLAAEGLARRGYAVAMSSLEMSRKEIILRLISSRANVLIRALLRHVVQPHQWDKIGAYRKEIESLPLYIDDRGGVTMSDIRAHVRATARRGRLGGVVVDYLQLVKSSDASRPRWEAVGDISRELKSMAREYNVPVIALSQLNRRTEGGVARPTLADLRESGNIEQDADVVLLLSRLLDPDTDEPGDEIEIIIGKNRHGPTAVATLFWEGAFTRISDMSNYR